MADPAQSAPHPLLESLEPPQAEALAALRARIAGDGAVVVAYSGGVDSALVGRSPPNNGAIAPSL